ncbi:TMEM175 family protein [Chitinophaga sp. RAB17]|uniref:TMEM175 family protein n=1 Tax=Chitinophaga sp. RAB17 TaxID=3233049 RepID=UPI003F93877E
MSHSKTAFQLERLILFSDAVFAIAITLLIIEIKIPHLLPEYTTAQVIDTYLELAPKFLGFFVSFFFIGLYWTVHHQLMGYLVNYNPGLLWLNLLFLVSIVLFPFSTALDSEYAGSNFISPFLIYTLNIAFSGSMIVVLWRYISNPKYQLSEGLDNRLFVQYQQKRALTVPAVFMGVFLLGLLLPFHSMSRTLLIAIPFIMRFLKRGYDRKMKALELKAAAVPVEEEVIAREE